MDFTLKSKKPMSKDEVAYFVDLIQNYPVLTSKETNVTTNKLKEVAWVSLTAAFNAKCGSNPRLKDQLKLKWDNLKKGARKRSQEIRMNNLKTGAEKADFIPPDEILNKVANLMGTTCKGSKVPFGGDGIADGSTMLKQEAAAQEELQVHLDGVATVHLPDIDTTPTTSGAKKRKSTAVEDDTSGCNVGAKFLYRMPMMKSKKSMSKDEVAYFVDLIQNYSVLTSKETNATTNKLKEDAWVSLTAAFNAKCESIPRLKDQLKLKWDNLKKAARRRSQLIRMNNLKTGAEKADFIPPDEILDKVANILAATGKGFMVPFDGDEIADCSTMLEQEVASEGELQEHLDGVATVHLPDNDTAPKTSGAKKRKFTAVEDDTSGCNAGAKILYRILMMAKSLQNNGNGRKIEDGRLERNLAVANYYNKKTEKLDIEIKLLKLQLLNKERGS